MNTRWLGTLLIVGTLIFMLSGFRTTALGLDDNISELAGMLWSIGGVCCIVGLIRLNGLGSNVVARALAFLPMLGFAALTLTNGLMVAGFITARTPSPPSSGTAGGVSSRCSPWSFSP